MLNTAITAAKKAGHYLKSNFREDKIVLSDLGGSDSRSGVSSQHDVESDKIIIEQILNNTPPNQNSVVIYSEESEFVQYSRVNDKWEHKRLTPIEYFGYRGKKWTIDPLCGSIPYARGVADFIVSIALIEDNEITLGVVYDPIQDELFHAQKGQGAYLNNTPISYSNTSTLNKSYISIEHKFFRLAPAKPLQKLVCDIQRIRVAGTCALEMVYVACGRLDAMIKLNQPLYDYAAGLLIANEATNNGGIYGIKNLTKHYGKIDEKPLSFVCANSKIVDELYVQIKDWIWS